LATESRLAWLCLSHLRRASMGPSPVGDGKDHVVRYVGQTQGQLQWGRRLLATESRWYWVGRYSADVASMGPSPVGDGKQDRVVNWDGKYRASMGPSPVGDGKLVIKNYIDAQEALQWGRRLLATESRVESSDEGTLFEASMGPSPVGDGKQRDRHGHGVELSASMGPSPVGDGKAAEQSPPR